MDLEALPEVFPLGWDLLNLQHNSRFKVGPDKFQYPLVAYSFSQQIHQLIMVNPVEELFQIQINYYIVPFVNVMLCLFNGLMCITSGMEAVAVLRKFYLEIGDNTCAMACCIIRSTAVGIPNSLIPPSGLGIVYPAYRLGSVLPSQ